MMSPYLCTVIKKENMKNWIIKNKLTILGVVLGSIAGYLYYHFIGCASGSCAISSKPFNSTLYGALMGGLLLSSFKKEDKTENNKTTN